MPIHSSTGAKYVRATDLEPWTSDRCPKCKDVLGERTGGGLEVGMSELFCFCGWTALLIRAECRGGCTVAFNYVWKGGRRRTQCPDCEREEPRRRQYLRRKARS